MKFGKRLLKQASTVNPEWKDNYIDYKRLKKTLREELKAPSTKHEGKAFQLELEKQLAKVNSFYTDVECRASQSLSSFQSAKNDELASQRKTPTAHIDEFVAFCRQLDSIRSYVILNYFAVIKIVKKRNKQYKLASVPIETQEALKLLLAQPFYNSTGLAELTTKTEMLASEIIPKYCGSSSSSVRGLTKEDYTCPICLEVLTNPVVLSCTHRFCMTCLCKAAATKQACPVCRKEQILDPSCLHVDSVLGDWVEQHFIPSDSSEAEAHRQRLEEEKREREKQQKLARLQAETEELRSRLKTLTAENEIMRAESSMIASENDRLLDKLTSCERRWGQERIQLETMVQRLISAYEKLETKYQAVQIENEVLKRETHQCSSLSGSCACRIAAK